MKTIYMKKMLLLLFMLPALAIANDCTEVCNSNHKHKYEKSKTLKKEYAVNSDALLKVNNRYGNVDVTSWNENRIVIDVKITVSGNDEDKVLSRLDMIDVNFEGSRNEVSAKTIIEKKSSNWSWSWGKKSNVHYKINYKIKVPITNNVNLMNDYGNLSLNELKGDAYLNCDYGNIDAGDLHSTNNRINLDYGNANIALIRGGSINVDYSNFNVEEAGNIRLNADYTNTVFEKLKNINYNCDYGSLKINNAVSVVGDGDYLTTRLGSISKKVAITADYGSLRIEELKDGFDSVVFNGDYCGIKIGVPNSAFSYVIKLSYGSFRRNQDRYEFTKQIVKTSSKYYEGYFKSQNSSSTIKIDSDYGSVHFIEK